jgi:hypothetical protein
MGDNQRSCRAKIAEIRVFGSEAGWVRHAPPKTKVILHLTEDQVPVPSSGIRARPLVKGVGMMRTSSSPITRWQRQQKMGQVTQL